MYHLIVVTEQNLQMAPFTERPFLYVCTDDIELLLFFSWINWIDNIV